MSAVAIAIVISAGSLYHLAPKYEDFVYAFYEHLNSTEQLALLALLFSVVFAAAALAPKPKDVTPEESPPNEEPKDVLESAATLKNDEAPPKYPLEAMAAAKSDKERFQAIFPMLRDELVEHMRSNGHDLPQEACQWVKEMMDYTVPGGKLNRGTTVVSVYELLHPAASPTEIAQASVLGWAIEFLQAFFLVADDVMDDSPTRRGQPCWYKIDKVGLIAINDSFILESFVFTILKKHFGKTPYYTQLVELFLDVTQKTEFGQLLDLTSQPQSGGKVKIDLNRFTWDRYRQIVQYKTAYYTFYLPVAIGMITSDVTNPETYKLAQSICLQMGQYFQIQDDYLDCFGDPKHIGKVGTDIQDNKCSWLVVQALKRCDASGKKILEQNYGQWDNWKVKKVKDLYKKLDLSKVFTEYEEESYKNIQEELKKIDGLMPTAVFEILLKKIYKRSY